MADRFRKRTRRTPAAEKRGGRRQSPDESDAAPAFTLTILLQHVGKLIEDRMRSGFEDLGLHPAQGQVLHLLERGEGVSQRSLTRMMKIAAPTVSGILKRMEATGLIERRSDPNDERVVRVYQTPSGRGMARSARAVVDQVERMLIVDLSRSRLRAAHTLLRRLRDNLGGEPPGKEPPATVVVR